MDIYSTFKGKHIFITGGVGFIGKVLIEKLLRSFPDLGNIYVLIRNKKGKTPEARLNMAKENVLFDKLKSMYPDALNKVKAIEGDVSQHNLGINEEDRKLLTENVNIIYHIAASIRFDDPLQYAIKINIRSTRDVIELASEAKNLAVFVHVSTTYGNTDRKIVEEKIYPPHGNWRDAIALAETSDEEVISAFTMKYIKPLENTYTYAKSLAEHAVVELCEGKIPAIVVRPSVVISTIREPLRGWNDNLNGPVGLLVAGGKGLLRICYGDPNSVQDYVPVDSVASLLIYAVYTKIQTKDNGIEVYNNSKYKLNDTTVGEVIEMGSRLIQDAPFSQVMWYPRFSMTNCWYNYYIQVLLFHMVPAFFLDIILKLAGHKPILFTIQRKIYIANTVLANFIQHEWDFVNTKSMELQRNMRSEDREVFSFENVINVDREGIYEYFRDSKIGVAQNMFKENMDKDQNRKKIWRLWLLDVIVKGILFGLFLWYWIFRSNCIQCLYGKLENYVNSL